MKPIEKGRTGETCLSRLSAPTSGAEVWDAWRVGANKDKYTIPYRRNPAGIGDVRKQEVVINLSFMQSQSRIQDPGVAGQLEIQIDSQRYICPSDSDSF